MTPVVYLDRLPINSEPSFIHTVFDDDEKAGIKEIHTFPGGRGACAWVVFDSQENAENAAARYDGRQFGPVSQKTHASLKPESLIPTSATNTLTKFLHDRDNQIESRTVRITHLPENHTLRSMNALFGPMMEAFDCHEPEEDPYFGSYEPNEILHMKSPQPGVGLVQLAKPSMAVKVVREFAGTYLKNGTLDLRCVPDEEMEDLLVDTGPAHGKAIQLFVGGIKPGSSKADIQNIFTGYKVLDVRIPGGGKSFCFMFARQKDADAILAKYEKGFNFEGRTIRVNLADKGKKKGGGNPSTPGSPSTPRGSTTDLKVNNLPYGVAESTIRMLFQGFNVSKVVIRHGFAFVGIASNEVERAIQELNDKPIGEMNISVKVSERRKG
ncbi:hypothetical protein P153DRAFT_369660 [Dothidotthia symphoricarpi CBS 119687]|uniref:RRM domain-containing protein n=1 Tax=Dothidotthia symphoricarpi CBS 119687 TaxID=1392245 RepID=A0A6A6A4V5_9PLEO|nr:uncharacterized protein P153DRAFT_369660 [Dothidotthia symphoricarpi CBS 119687]KAF2125631.1 hypothetical protein P153DRAFT_369660 [Dothidotthia symphoricarpi CBS 119687]